MQDRMICKYSFTFFFQSNTFCYIYLINSFGWSLKGDYHCQFFFFTREVYYTYFTTIFLNCIFLLISVYFLLLFSFFLTCGALKHMSINIQIFLLVSLYCFIAFNSNWPLVREHQQIFHHLKFVETYFLFIIALPMFENDEYFGRICLGQFHVVRFL